MVFLINASFFFCLFACQVIFYWIQDIINLILLDAGYFCIPINTLAFYPEMQLSYLAIVWCFQVRRIRALIFPYYKKTKLFSVAHPVNYKDFYSGCCAHIILGLSHMSHNDCFSNSSGFFPWPWAGSSQTSTDQ